MNSVFKHIGTNLKLITKAKIVNVGAGAEFGDISVVGNPIRVISGQGATKSLLASEGGSTVLFDRATGLVYTLPAATLENKGVSYRFIGTVECTSNNYTIKGASASDIYYGGLSSQDAAAGADVYVANATSDYKIVMSTSTAGELQGTDITVTCIGLNKWAVSGTLHSTSMFATPFAS